MKDAPRANSRYLLLMVALIALSLLCALAWPAYQPASAQNPAANLNGKIAFVSSRNGPPGEIYVMNPDGSDQRNITNSPASETRPAFSPDGKKIAFVRDFKGIFVMNPDGSGQTQILDGATAGLTSISDFPDWSPDGTKIVFRAIPKGSPDGGDIYVINADGTGLTRLTTDPGSDGGPCWSPDGKKIAFATDRDRVPNEINYEIYVMNADGSNQTRITNNTKFDTGPAWSPDGKRIAFTSRRDDNFEVYVMNADGSNQTRLTNNPEQDSDAKWSPDGTKIVFMSSRDGRFGEIYTMNPDGTGLINLTNADGFDMDPSWQRLSSPFIPPSPTPTPTPTGPPGETWVPFDPVADQASIDVLACGGRTFAKVKFTFLYIDRIADWGKVGNFGSDLSSDVKVERWTGVAIATFYTTEQIYDLGTLAPGTYTFTLKSRGVELKNKVFTIGSAPSSPANDAEIFVWQHYLDFLGRGPDDQGWGFWAKNLTSGCGTDAACLERKRIDTSAAFFMSIEFQATGDLVFRLYRASYGRMPRREEFLPDARTVSHGVVVNAPGWEIALADNTRVFLDDWVARADFKFEFDQLTDAQFIDRLIANTGITMSPDARAAMIADLGAGRQTRAQALLAIVNDEGFRRREFNRAFVLMQYFGYLQRNPDEGPDSDLSGYNFWLAKLDQFNGDYVRAEMVKAFINSSEYRGRFCSQ